MKLAENPKCKGSSWLSHTGRKEMGFYELIGTVWEPTASTEAYSGVVDSISIDNTEYMISTELARTRLSSVSKVQRASTIAKSRNVVTNKKATSFVPYLGPMSW
jgi:hypothetical protein